MHAYFEYHAGVGLRFKLAFVLGELWTRDGGVPQRCPLSIMFILACMFLGAGICARWVGSVLNYMLITCSVWPLTCLTTQGGQVHYCVCFCQLGYDGYALLDSVRCWRTWTVKFDVRDFGGHMDTSLRGWVTTLTSRVAAAGKDVEAVAVLPGGFGAKLGNVRSKFLSASLHDCEASKIAQRSFLKFRSACTSTVWSRRMPLAQYGTVLRLLDGPVGCDPGFCVIWNRFRLVRRFSAYRPGEVMRLIGLNSDVAPGHGSGMLPCSSLSLLMSRIWEWDC